jgi:hypothetical protein
MTMALVNGWKGLEKKKLHVRIIRTPRTFKIYRHVVLQVSAANLVGLSLVPMCQCLQDAITDIDKFRLRFRFSKARLLVMVMWLLNVEFSQSCNRPFQVN